MFDTIDAALYYPSREHTYFFKGPHYLKYRHGHGVVVASGRTLRRIGVDGWKSFPAEFRQDLDAALYYPPNGHAYFFRGSKYIKYRPGDGVVPLDDGQAIRRIGSDGWASFPDSFTSGVDAALFYSENDHAYFFKGSHYIKYKPGSGVVRIGSRAIRNIGSDGWSEIPDAFKTGIDAALLYPPRDKVYFFRDRDYARWEPGEGADTPYPRRIGLLHRDHGGWPGLSHVVAGPLVGATTDQTARLWIWMIDSASAANLTVEVNGVSAAYSTIDPVDPDIVGDVGGVVAGSQIRIIELSDLAPATNYSARVSLDGTTLDAVTFQTAPTPASKGRVRILVGSCADMSVNRDVPTFEAMAGANGDMTLLCGDNCYYVHADLRTGETGPRPRDWESACRMLLRQIEARNHPQFTELSRSTPVFSTWDDHDFAYNNASGLEFTDDWVGRKVAGAVFRAMWPNPFQSASTSESIHYSFRWGPCRVFMTDSRFHKDKPNSVVWGDAQLQWLLNGMTSSSAPLKIVVTSGQFLFNRDDQEGHATQAPAERQAFLDHVLGAARIPASVTGRVLLLSGDVHFSELMRLPGSEPPRILELTSSPMRRDGLSAHPKAEKASGSRIWAARRNGFGIVEVDVKSKSEDGGATGTVTLEIRDDEGNPIDAGGRRCRSIWNLGTGELT